MKNTVNKYFEVKVKMQKTQEDGTQKKVSEQYVVEAATFGEAERRITECLKPYIEGEFDVTDIKIAVRMQTGFSRPRFLLSPWMRPPVRRRKPLSCI